MNAYSPGVREAAYRDKKRAFKLITRCFFDSSLQTTRAQVNEIKLSRPTPRTPRAPHAPAPATPRPPPATAAPALPHAFPHSATSGHDPRGSDRAPSLRPSTWTRRDCV